MRSSYCRFWTILAFLFSILASSSVFADFNLIQRSSFVNTTVFNDDFSSQGNNVFFEQLDTFDFSSSVGSTQGSQLSSIIDNVFDVELFSQGGNASDQFGFTEATNAFFVEFEVLTPSVFSLTGNLFQDGAEAVATVDLDGPNTNISFISSTLPSQPVIVDSNGTLEPGNYRLNVNATSLGGGASDQPGGPTSADITFTVNSFQSVPEPSSLSVLLGLALAAGCRRRRN